MEDVFQVKQVSYHYRLDTPILENATITLPYNSFNCLVGPSGTGKNDAVKSFGAVGFSKKG